MIVGSYLVIVKGWCDKMGLRTEEFSLSIGKNETFVVIIE